jgi:hypothetical protein
LFHAATARDRYLQSVPLASDRPPLSRRLASLPLSTSVPDVPPRPYCLRFPRRPHPKAQLPGSPTDYEFPFHKPEDLLPGRPGSKVTEPSRSANFTDFEAFLPLSSPFTSRRVTPSQRPMLSWPSASLEFFPQSLEPRTPLNPKVEDHRRSRASSFAPTCDHEDQ